MAMVAVYRHQPAVNGTPCQSEERHGRELPMPKIAESSRITGAGLGLSAALAGHRGCPFAFEVEKTICSDQTLAHRMTFASWPLICAVRQRAEGNVD